MAEQKEEKTEINPSIGITYFGVHGRGAPLRAACSIGSLSYENNLITFAQNKQLKAEGKRRWSGVPEIKIYDKDSKELVTVGQSNTCLRYIGMSSPSIYCRYIHAHYYIICTYITCTHK